MESGRPRRSPRRGERAERVRVREPSAVTIKPKCRTLQKRSSAFQKFVVPAVEAAAGDEFVYLDMPDYPTTDQHLREIEAVRRGWREALVEVMRSKDPRRIELLEIVGGAVGFSDQHLHDEVPLAEQVEALRDLQHIPPEEQRAVYQCYTDMFSHRLP